MIPTPQEFTQGFTDYAYAVTVGRARKIYPSPFFDIASTYFPTNIKELFKFVKYIITTNELINTAIEKLSSYPITNFLYYRDEAQAKKFRGIQNENLPYLSKWKDILNNDLQLKSKMKAIGKSYYAYGNAFVSLYVPFSRMMYCKKCNKNLPVNGLKYKYLPNKKQFEAECRICGEKSYKVWDEPKNNTKEFNIIIWDPALIDLDYHPLSDTADIYYNIHANEKKRIRDWKDEEYINRTPLSFIQSVYEEKNSGRIKFNRKNIMHIKRELIPGLFPGWGWPLPAVVLKQAFYLQLLRKANETIFEQHILPFIALFPQPTQGLDIYRQVNLGDWKSEVQAQLENWRRDPANFGIFPFPLGFQMIGGQGKAFELVQEANNISEAIVIGMGIPRELIFGGLSWSASSVSLRIVENDMLNFREEMLNFPNKFLIPKLSAILGLPKIYCALQDFKMADDLQQQQLSFQLMSNRIISKQTFFKDSGYHCNYEDEQERIEKEINDEIEVQEKLSLAQAKIQGASGLVQLQYQTAAMGIQAEQQRLSQIPTLPPPPPPPPPDQQFIQAHQLLASMLPPQDIERLLGMSSWQLNDLVARGKISPEIVQAVMFIKSQSPMTQQQAAQMPQAAQPQMPMPVGGGEAAMVPVEAGSAPMPPAIPMPLPENTAIPEQSFAPVQTGVINMSPVKQNAVIPEDIKNILEAIPQPVVERLMQFSIEELKTQVKDGKLDSDIFRAIKFMKDKMQEDYPASPNADNKAKKNKNTAKSISKEELDQLVVLPTDELVTMLANGQISKDLFDTVIAKKVEGYRPAQPMPTTTPPEQAAIQLPREVLQQLIQMPPEQIQMMAQQGQIPIEVAEIVLRQQQNVQSVSVPAAIPQEQVQISQPAQQLPPGQLPGQLQPPPQLPPIPPEFISPSGVPYSAKELINAGVSPLQLLQVGYSPEDLKEAGVPAEFFGFRTDNVHGDALRILTAMEGMDPAQINYILMNIQQTDPILSQIISNKLVKEGRLKTALNPFSLLSLPPTASNLAGMPSDMESPFVDKDPTVESVKKLLNDFSARQKKNTESNKTNPNIKGPNENSPNKKYTG